MNKRWGSGIFRSNASLKWRQQAGRFRCGVIKTKSYRHLAKLLRAHHYRLVKWGAVATGTLSLAAALFIILARPDSARQNIVEKAASVLAEKAIEIAEPTPVLSGFDLSIPKLGLWAPVMADVDGYDHDAYAKALANGVAHFKDTAKPDNAGGNIFIFGHSTDWQWSEGNYKTIFRNLPDAEIGDEIIVYYRNETYRYLVNQKEIVSADDLVWLQPTPDKVITLMTCYPIGSNSKRLIVRGKIKE